tara:strand:- start:140 stop:1528 length:1389 start_codon:yes stop_codon:yes gene_type:complete
MGAALAKLRRVRPEESEGVTPTSSLDSSLNAGLLATPSAPKLTAWQRLLPVTVFVALITVQIASAAYGVVTKKATNGVSGVNPLIFSLVRDALSIPVLGLIALILDGFLLPARSDLFRFVLLGVFGMFANQFCYILGLVYIDAGLASVINLLTPVCAWCFATTIGLDRFSWYQAAGLVIAVIGAMIFVGVLDLGKQGDYRPPPSSPTNASLFGLGLEDKPMHSGGTIAASVTDIVQGSFAVFGSCLSYSFALILMKPMLKVYPPVTVTAWSYVSGVIVMGIASLIYVPWSKEWTERPDPFKLRDPFKPTIGMAWKFTPDAWIAVAVAVVANSVLKYGLTSFANKHTSITVLAMFGTLVPVLTYFGEWLSGEHLEWHLKYLGAIGIVVGLITVVFFKGPAPNPKGLRPWRRRLLQICARVVPDGEMGEGGRDVEEDGALRDFASSMLDDESTNGGQKQALDQA